jgi:hypothetical protein
MTAYIIVGMKENVYQDNIGEPIEPNYDKEIVCGFFDLEKAKQYITDSRLDKPIKKSYSGNQYYKGGYYEMDYETVEIE